MIEAVDRISRGLGRIAAGSLALMVALGAFNAVARYVGRFAGQNISSNALLDAQWMLFGVTFLLGSAAAVADDKHVRVDVVYAKCSPRIRAWIDGIGTFALLLPFAVVAFLLCAPSALNAWEIREGSPDPGGLPRFPIKAVVWLAFGWHAIQGLGWGLRRWLALRGEPRT